MPKSYESRLVIKVTGHWGYYATSKSATTKYIALKNDDSDHREQLSGYSAVVGVIDVRDAIDLKTVAVKSGMELFYNIKSILKDQNTIELVTVKVTVETTPAEFDPDQLRDYLRGTALSKLSSDEIEALGVTNLAIYDKLKYYKVVDPQE